MNAFSRVLILVGPTASGKTAVSLKLAELLNGEIVSADSRQVYRGMDIGTAKPAPEEIGDIPHHCLDILDPEEPFSAGDFARLAREAVIQIIGRKRVPIIVGGSGLYVQALVDGFFPGNYRNIDLRANLKEEAKRFGSGYLYARLQSKDPCAAGKIHPNDQKRIIRALEVYSISGKPISSVQKEETLPGFFSPNFYGLRFPREILKERIRQRVDQMVEQGLFEEVRKLMDSSIDPGANSLDSLGYKETAAFLRGEIGKDEAVERIKRNTVRFAKRQMTWFRRDSRIKWIDIEETTPLNSAAEIIARHFQGENP
ncbi:MAG TPA: tRNA (adenosine(37)-N6)-dimethylallyltransferase MiaA [bacterium]|nr:tRNA (adenosine(37)-N6)-dimethylallyltransferase MiaA [bacterium]